MKLYSLEGGQRNLQITGDEQKKVWDSRSKGDPSPTGRQVGYRGEQTISQDPHHPEQGGSEESHLDGTALIAQNPCNKSSSLKAKGSYGSDRARKGRHSSSLAPHCVEGSLDETEGTKDGDIGGEGSQTTDYEHGSEGNKHDRTTTISTGNTGSNKEEADSLVPQLGEIRPADHLAQHKGCRRHVCLVCQVTSQVELNP